ncbi:MAG: OmpA family protein, partial [Planctomycetes bacterium]|nr:OmpA family protein [Planctomycetota bacterium]
MADSEDDVPGVPEWIVTYGDMMSLLLTFFIMLVSLSSIKEDSGSMRAMLEAIRETFGPTQGKMASPGKSSETKSILDKRNSTGSRSEGGSKKASLKTALGTGGQSQGVKRINHGTRISLGGPAYFNQFDASPTKELQQNLDIIARVVAKKSNQLMIRGHATREPLPADVDLTFQGFPIRNQWDLSFARAVAVAEYLQKLGLDRRRMVLSAAGDTEPRNSTRKKDVRKLNRRVDVFLIDAYIT